MKKFILLTSILLLGTFTQAATEFHSVYTSVDGKDCVTFESSDLDPDPVIDYLTQECPGFGGYRVFVSGGDLRYPLSLRYGEVEIRLTQFWAFHEVGSKVIEWIYSRKAGGEVEYKALIHRLSHDADPDPQASVLIVTKLDKEKTCPVGMVRSGAEMNQKARKLAEEVEKMKCLSFEDLSL